MRLARVPDYDKEQFLPSRKLRRMGSVSQAWVISCLLARDDAGLGGEGTAAPPAERRGTFLGTGFGCVDTTWDYMMELVGEGAGTVNPFYFAESVANAPAGHSAIALDTRALTVTFTCGDASAASAVAAGARAIRQGRVDLAYCGGVELLTPGLLRILAAVGAPPFVGEGAACLVLESAESARARGARVLAEIEACGLASDPAASPTDWGRDPGPIRRAMIHAMPCALGPAPAGIVNLHACGSPEAEEAEMEAAREVCPQAGMTRVSRVVGGMAAAGGLNLVAAVIRLSEDPPGGESRRVLVNSLSWGGTLVSVGLRAG